MARDYLVNDFVVSLRTPSTLITEVVCNEKANLYFRAQADRKQWKVAYSVNNTCDYHRERERDNTTRRVGWAVCSDQTFNFLMSNSSSTHNRGR